MWLLTQNTAATMQNTSDTAAARLRSRCPTRLTVSERCVDYERFQTSAHRRQCGRGRRRRGEVEAAAAQEGHSSGGAAAVMRVASLLAPSLRVRDYCTFRFMSY